MTEEEWDAATSPRALVELLQTSAKTPLSKPSGQQSQRLASTLRMETKEMIGSQVSDRKLRLFVCGCVRQISELLPNGELELLCAIERRLDRPEFDEDFEELRRMAILDTELKIQVRDPRIRERLRISIRNAVECVASTWGFFPNDGATSCVEATWWAMLNTRPVGRNAQAEAIQSQTRQLHEQSQHLRQVHLLRDIFGNPFRPVVADPVWLNSTAVGIAEAIYVDRAFDRLPILADALEEAGCTNADLLLHCRQPGEHVRGCWVVDLVLGKK